MWKLSHAALFPLPTPPSRTPGLLLCRCHSTYGHLSAPSSRAAVGRNLWRIFRAPRIDAACGLPAPTSRSPAVPRADVATQHHSHRVPRRRAHVWTRDNILQPARDALLVAKSHARREYRHVPV
ncbi:hypothetical protein B0H17DRAFT_1328900, partial [Mycena rosella]